MRPARAVSVLMMIVVMLLGACGAALAQEGEPDEPPTIRMARATWDTDWFQAEIYRELFNLLGYRVDGPVTMENQEFYDAVAAGRVDVWVNGWFPLPEPLVDADDPVSLVGTQVDAGALQGYFVDMASAEALQMDRWHRSSGMGGVGSTGSQGIGVTHTGPALGADGQGYSWVARSRRR